MKSGDQANSLSRADGYRIGFGKAAGIAEPSKRTLHNLPLRQDFPLRLDGCRDINAKLTGNILPKGFAVSCVGTEASNGWVFATGGSCGQDT